MSDTCGSASIHRLARSIASANIAGLALFSGRPSVGASTRMRLVGWPNRTRSPNNGVYGDVSGGARWSKSTPSGRQSWLVPSQMRMTISAELKLAYCSRGPVTSSGYDQLNSPMPPVSV
jgi:hypothetical protein